MKWKMGNEKKAWKHNNEKEMFTLLQGLQNAEARLQ